MSKILSPQVVVLLWIFGPLLALSTARAVAIWRGSHVAQDWGVFLVKHLGRILSKMPLAIALAVVGFWA